ncbi:LysR family transcriptional regulator [Pontibacterium sp. N1Y112]|uniref:LysR family transcriptional regulator n=1 Tax=Pontibacterium sinense TaxID=2781979 RepID=A0A8J7FWP6_9GAMM|nr:LysR family transcriptional regulator [Pontibacterium sinense]MBE9398985.1 LysR family transcriptional regulator [Pontibacterium sinense]
MKPLRQFDLNLLIIFEALITESHVSRAAEKVCLSQSAMSHALNRLREQMNDPLLVRTEGGLHPTPRALAMLPEVRKALQLIEQTLNPPPPFSESHSNRRFRIAATDYFETVVFPGWFSQLQQRAPQIKVEIDLIAMETAYSRLEKGTVDLIVGLDASQPLPPRLIVEPWITQQQVCIAGINNKDIADNLSLADYLNQPHVVFFDLESETANPIDSWLSTQNTQRDHISRITNYTAGARITARTNAIMTLPFHMAQLFCEMLPLRIVTPPEGIPEIEMTIVQHPLYAEDPAIQWLKQEVQGYARAMMTTG